MISTDKPAPKELKAAFDRAFNRYCSQLRFGIPTKIFVKDTQENRLLMQEFNNYLEQRANFEGWNYNFDKFQVIYASGSDMTPGKTIHFNPLNQNIALREIDAELGTFTRVGQSEADEIVTRVKKYVK